MKEKSDGSPTLASQRLHRRVGLGVLAAAFLLFFSLTPGYPQPWDWSAALVAVLGLDTFRPLSQPLWQFLMAALGQFVGPRLTGSANLVSVLAGAVCVWLVFEITARLGRPVEHTTAKPTDPAYRTRIHILGGLLAAAYAAVSVPLLLVSTRAHGGGLGAALLLGALLATVNYRKTGRPLHAYLFALLYGLGAVEFAALLLASPFLLLAWPWMLWRRRQLKAQLLVRMAALALIGVAGGLLFCWMYYQQPAAKWREFNSYFRVLTLFAGDHVRQVLHSVPKVGWLTVFLFMILPAAQVFSRDTQAPTDFFTRLGLWLFRAVTLLLALLPLLDFPSTPWRMAGLDKPLLTPYLVAAIWSGHVLACWLNGWLAAARPARLTRRTTLATLIILATLPGLGVVGWRHIRVLDPGQGEPAQALAREIVRSLDGRTFLLTEGTLDPLIQLAARAEKVEVKLLNRRYGRSRPYQRYIATWFPDRERQSMARMGIQPLLAVWFEGDPDIARQLAVLDYPDVWSTHGYRPIPHRAVYLGLATNQPLDVATVAGLNFAFLETQQAQLKTPRAGDQEQPLHKVWPALHLNRLANNLGVLLEEEDRPEEAWRAYALALAFKEDNIRTLLNQFALAKQTGRPETEALKERLQARPMADDDPATRLALTTLLERSPTQLESEDVYLDILKTDPANPAALRGLIRLYLVERRTGEVGELLDRLEESGVPPAQLVMERAGWLLMQEKLPEARKVFEQALEANPKWAEAWLGLYVVAQTQNDAGLEKSAREQLERFPAFAPGMLLIAHHALQARNPALARRTLERARRAQPHHRLVLQELIKIKFRQGDRGEMTEDLAALLALDPANQWGNYVLSTVHYLEGNLALAETALRRSLEQQPWAPALNDLAWILYEQDKLDEALTLAEQAVEREPRQAHYLGMIQFKQGRLEEAAARHEQALQLAGGQLPFLDLHLAMIYEAQGRRPEAQAILEKLEPRLSELPEKNQREHSALKAKLARPRK